jgi:transcriptional regulator with XRE-family HTH domain
VRNERLRRAMLAQGLSVESLAERVDASAKSVRRWLDGASVPYPKTRYRVAALLQEDESWLWPEAVDAASLAGAELIASWPRRSDVPPRLWTDLLRATERNIDLLAFAGLFLVEGDPDWIPLLRDRAAHGARVRLLLGDPAGTHLASRDAEARIGGAVAGRVAAVLTAYEPLTDQVEIRLHDTPLYNSIYRFDDHMLINTHVYGILAAYTPVLHLRRVDGAYFNTYLESFDQVWANASPLQGGRHG